MISRNACREGAARRKNIVATHNCHAAVLLRRSGHWAGNGYQKVGRNCIPGNTNLHPRGNCQTRHRQPRGTLDTLAGRLRPRADTLTMLLYKGKAVKPRSKSNNSWCTGPHRRVCCNQTPPLVPGLLQGHLGSGRHRTTSARYQTIWAIRRHQCRNSKSYRTRLPRGGAGG